MNMIRLLSLFILISSISCTPTVGQKIVTKKTASKKSLQLYEEALDYPQDEKGKAKTIKKLESLLTKELSFLDAHLVLGTMYDEKGEYQKSIEHYTKVTELDPNYKPRVFFALGNVQEKVKDFDGAVRSYKTLLNYSKKTSLIEKTKKAIVNAEFKKGAYNNPVAFNPTYLNNNINTNNQEYLPFITADGLEMIFTRRDRDENFYSTSYIDGQWSEPKYLEDLNTPTNEGAHTLSPDGKTLYFTFCDDKVTYGSCDLFYSKKKDDKWQKPKNLGKRLNSPAWDTQPTVSADGRTMYFVSKRSGGYGGADLWYSNKMKKGGWGEPINAGPSINTNKDELTPYLHNDGQTLYFSSEGHPGMGGKDIFFTRLDKNGQWVTPTNIGYPINTENNEADLFVDLAGKKAYFASDTKEKGNMDIGYFDLPEYAQPQNVIYVKGTVKDKKTKNSIRSIVNINQIGGTYAAKIYTDKKGDYLICLPSDHSYTFNVSQKNYLFYSERLDIPVEQSQEIVKNIDLSPLQKTSTEPVLVKNEPIILNNVLFESGRYELLPVSRVELNNLVQLMNDLKVIHIRIVGHTDNVGNSDENLILSENRAKSVVDYLVEKGIDITRLKYQGKGQNEPIDTNDTEEGKQRNRRTTFEVIN